MKFHIKDMPEELAINTKIKRKLFFYIILSFIIISGLYFERFFPEPYKYIFISPSLYNFPYLSWTTGVWGSFLGIHGTIAALSITFMGMFVGQVSTASEYGFESISKTLLLRNYRFLEFSIQSVSSLLFGLFLLLSGSGVLGYCISSIFSLYFIINYGVMYFKLYNLTEKPGIINSVLLNAIQKTGEKHKEINTGKQQLNEAFYQLIANDEAFTNEHKIAHWNDNAVRINITTNNPELVISGFEPKILNALSSKIREANPRNQFIVYFSISFIEPLTNSVIKIIPTGNTKLEDTFIEEIGEILDKCFLFTPPPYIYEEFKQFEEALINNIRNSLLKGDEWSLDFGVKTFHELTSHYNYLYTLKNIDLSISSSNKKDIIETSLFATFFEKMIIEKTSHDNFEKKANIMRSLIGLARYIYSKNNFFEFYKKIFVILEYKVRYRSDKTNYIFLDLYISNVITNFVYSDYQAFDLDTNFITKKLKYLDLDDTSDHDSLNEMQRKILKCLFEVTTLLIMRIEHVMKKKSDSHAELEKLKQYLRDWINAKFLNDLYFKKEVYDLLFTIPHDYSLLNAETTLREIPYGEATWRSIANDTYKMIAFILTQNSFNGNKLDLLFSGIGYRFKKNTGIRTHELNSLISYLKDQSFLDLLIFTSDEQEVKSNKDQVIAKLESMASGLNSLILQDVIQSELDPNLVKEYTNEIRISVVKYFDLILRINDIPLDKGVHSKDVFLLINKREIIPSIDGVSYEMNIHNHSQYLIYDWIRNTLNNLQQKQIEVIDIDSLQDLKTEKLITIEYKINNRVNIYKYSKGLKIDDKEGHLKLNDSGMYYLDLHENFSLKRAENTLSVDISKITKENIEVVKEKYNFGDENPYLYSTLKATLKVSAVPKESCILYFLSEEKCKSMNERQEREMEQLYNNRSTEDFGDHIIN